MDRLGVGNLRRGECGKCTRGRVVMMKGVNGWGAGGLDLGFAWKDLCVGADL